MATFEPSAVVSPSNLVPLKPSRRSWMVTTWWDFNEAFGEVHIGHSIVSNFALMIDSDRSPTTGAR